MAILLNRDRYEGATDPSSVKKEPIYSEGKIRWMLFILKEGQTIPPHKNPGHVHVTVLSGTGRFVAGEGEAPELKSGESILYQPEESHGFEAVTDLVLQAMIVQP